MPELPRTQKLSCESTASENTWCFDRPRPPTRLPFLIPLFRSAIPYSAFRVLQGTHGDVGKVDQGFQKGLRKQTGDLGRISTDKESDS